LDAYEAAIGAGKTFEEAQKAAEDAVAKTVECGLSGRDPSTGECVTKDDAAIAAAGDVSSAAAAEFATRNPEATDGTGRNAKDAANANAGGDDGTDGDADSSKAAGVPIIPIAAGAGGAVLIIIIVIIIVVVRRKNSQDPQPKAQAKDRTVVAFENPMYDTPEQTPGAQGTFGHQNGNAADSFIPVCWSRLGCTGHRKTTPDKAAGKTSHLACVSPPLPSLPDEQLTCRRKMAVCTTSRPFNR